MSITLALLEGERGALIGQTGTGKTFLAKHYLLPQTGRLAIIDPKGEFDFGGTEVFDSVGEIERRRPERFIYRPNLRELRDFGAHDAIYRHLYDAGGFYVYTDEVTSMLRGMEPPPGLLDIYARGRSRGITCLSATQRPSRIPILLLSECRKFYAFRVIFPVDVKRLQELIPGYTGKLPSAQLIDQFTELYGYRPKAQYAFRFFNAETEQSRTVILRDPNHAS